MTNDEDNIEFIVTIRCKICGEPYTGTFNTLSINELNGTSEDKISIQEKVE